MADEVRVVVVDDVVDAAATLAAALELSGYKVRTAHDGRQALAVIDEYAPHCVLLDVDMPDMDGCELSRQLRERYGSDIVLIAVTGRDDENERVAETFVRVDHYLRKPLDLGVLGRILPPVEG